MIDAVNHGVEKRAGQDSLAFKQRQEWRPVSTEADSHFGLLVAQYLADGLVFDKKPEYHKIQVCIVSGAMRQMRMLKKIGCEGQICCHRSLGSLFAGGGHKASAE